jgi:hypothetical protein
VACFSRVCRDDAPPSEAERSGLISLGNLIDRLPELLTNEMSCQSSRACAHVFLSKEEI